MITNIMLLKQQLALATSTLTTIARTQNPEICGREFSRKAFNALTELDTLEKARQDKYGSESSADDFLKYERTQAARIK